MHKMGYHGEFDHYCVDLNIVTYKNILYIMLSEKKKDKLGWFGPIFVKKYNDTHLLEKRLTRSTSKHPTLTGGLSGG